MSLMHDSQVIGTAKMVSKAGTVILYAAQDIRNDVLKAEVRPCNN